MPRVRRWSVARFAVRARGRCSPVLGDACDLKLSLCTDNCPGRAGLDAAAFCPRSLTVNFCRGVHPLGKIDGRSS